MNSPALRLSLASRARLSAPRSPHKPLPIWTQGEDFKDQERPVIAPQAAARAPERSCKRGRHVPRSGKPGGVLNFPELPPIVALAGANEPVDRAGALGRLVGVSGFLHQSLPPAIPLRRVVLSTTPHVHAAMRDHDGLVRRRGQLDEPPQIDVMLSPGRPVEVLRPVRGR